MVPFYDFLDGSCSRKEKTTFRFAHLFIFNMTNSLIVSCVENVAVACCTDDRFVLSSEPAPYFPVINNQWIRQWWLKYWFKKANFGKSHLFSFLKTRMMSHVRQDPLHFSSHPSMVANHNICQSLRPKRLEMCGVAILLLISEWKMAEAW